MAWPLIIRTVERPCTRSCPPVNVGMAEFQTETWPGEEMSADIDSSTHETLLGLNGSA